MWGWEKEGGIQTPKRVWSSRFLFFSTLTQPKPRIKMASLKSRHRQRLLLRRHLYGLMPSHVPLKTTCYSRQFGFTHQETYGESTHTAKRQKYLDKWEGVIGWLTSAKIEVNVRLNLKLIRLLSYDVQSVSCFRRPACCTVGKPRKLPHLRINTNK